MRLSDGSGFDLTEAGTKKSLAAYIVTDPAQVPGIARLGPDPMADDFTLEQFRSMLEGRRTQIKGLLRDQEFIAGVGNAYSDEILHVAKISPFAIAGTLAPEVVDRLYAALRDTLKSAVTTASGKPAKELKDAKRAGMRVHARTGQTVPGVRRHRARGVVRRHVAAVLRHLPDRRQAAGRPADVQAAQVSTSVRHDGPSSGMQRFRSSWLSSPS